MSRHANQYNRDLRTEASVRRTEEPEESYLPSEDPEEWPSMPPAAAPAADVIRHDHEYRPSLVVPGITYAFVAGAERNNIHIVDMQQLNLDLYQGLDLAGCAAAA